MQSVRTCSGEGGTPNNQLAAFLGGPHPPENSEQMQTPGFQSPPHPQRWESFWLTDCTFSYFRVQAHTFPEAVEAAPLALPLREAVRD